ncbi:hypothetical protein GGI05_006409, partial [Coemansia sp. RSA 2603]
MKNIKRLLVWWTRHTGAMGRRRRQARSTSDTPDAADTPSAGQPSTRRLFARRGNVSLDGSRGSYAGSAETLVDTKPRARAFSDPAGGAPHVYSYYPWPDHEHDDLVRRSPP